MEDGYRSRVYENLRLMPTESLVEIWQVQDHNEWQDFVFELVREILLNRLGELPPINNERQVELLLIEIEGNVRAEYYQKALQACEQAISLTMENADVYNYRGLIHDQLGDAASAMCDYQKATQLDPEHKEAWQNLLDLEKEMEESFSKSLVKAAMDRALEYAQEKDQTNAIQELQRIKPETPNLALAWNYRGMILESLDQLEPAIESYLEAVRINPRFWNARENLGNARYKLMEEMFKHQPEEFFDEETGETIIIPDCGDERLLGPLHIEEVLPGWLYMNRRNYCERGFPGYRARPDRSGYDPIDRGAEQGRMGGIIIRRLFTGTMRTHDPAYIVMLTLSACVLSLPLLPLLVFGPQNFIDMLYFFYSFGPFISVGLACFVNLLLSAISQPSDEDKEWGRLFY